MYEFLFRGRVLDDDAKRAAVLNHVGTGADTLKRHEADAAVALRGGTRGVQELAPRLFDRIADARIMKLAWDFLALKGGPTPGPNGGDMPITRQAKPGLSAAHWHLL